MLIKELLNLLIEFFHQIFVILLPPALRAPNREKMSAKAAPANSEVEYANYKTFNQILLRAKESLRKAIEADEKRVNKERLIALYKSAIRDLLAARAIRPCSCPRNKEAEIREQHEKIDGFLESAQDRLVKLEDDECRVVNISSSHALPSSTITSRPVIPIPRSTITTPTESLTKSQLFRNVNAKYGDEILSTVLKTTDTRLSDVEGNSAAKSALEESVVLPALNPRLFTGLRAPCKGILLFGPPGNGKTMMAKAVASECKSSFFNVSAATIMSKWVGDGERLVQALFQVARNAQPAIIFIDEVDSMLCERSKQENGAARRVKTEFLIQLDGCNSGSADDRVLVLAATNRPYELDEGILRRFPKRIFIDLPDAKARASMIQRTFVTSNTPARLSTKDLSWLATKTEGYSYSDLDALCRSAALVPLRSVDRTKLHRMTAAQLRPVDLSDFEQALQCVKPSLNDENRRRLMEFARKYAQISE